MDQIVPRGTMGAGWQVTEQRRDSGWVWLVKYTLRSGAVRWVGVSAAVASPELLADIGDALVAGSDWAPPLSAGG